MFKSPLAQQQHNEKLDVEDFLILSSQSQCEKYEHYNWKGLWHSSSFTDFSTQTYQSRRNEKGMKFPRDTKRKLNCWVKRVEKPKKLLFYFGRSLSLSSWIDTNSLSWAESRRTRNAVKKWLNVKPS